MPGIPAGDRRHDAWSVAVNAASLQSLASRDTGPPYGFEEFEQRAGRRAARRRAQHRGLAATFAFCGVAILAAILTQQPRTSPSAQMPELVYDTPYAAALEPAVVDVGRFTVRDTLADRIALLDLQLTEGRAYSAPEEDMAKLAATRAQLEQSLRSVTYAHALMTY
jgi:hypothetical protein